MTSALVSYAQNGEDVVLSRALGSIENGFYVEVGANHPTDDSVSRTFYDRGWSGIAIEPNPEYARIYREERQRDVVIEAAVTASAEQHVTFHIIKGTGLSTLVDRISEKHASTGRDVIDVTVPTARLDTLLDMHRPDGDIHFLLVDTEGAEGDVLNTIDLQRHRPWILVIEATEPDSTVQSHSAWEPGVLAAGYEFCLFDGLSRFYVASEHAAELKGLLSYPACVLDGYVRSEVLSLRNALAETSHQLERTTARAETAQARARHLTSELMATRQTFSWKLTAPLRLVKEMFRRTFR